MTKTMKIISRKLVDFPQFNWSIKRGEVKELPKNKELAEAILSCSYIKSIVVAEPSKSEQRRTDIQKKSKSTTVKSSKK